MIVQNIAHHLFGDEAEITVNLDMTKITLTFTVNGIKYPEVLEWNNLPSNFIR